MAGYSNKPTWQKLEIKQGERLLIINEPQEYDDFLGADCPKFIKITSKVGSEVDILHLFVRNREELMGIIPAHLSYIRGGGRIWISWPKTSSKISSDIKEQDLRDIVLPMGWVDTKVCAVSDDWSGLKFMRRNIA